MRREVRAIDQDRATLIEQQVRNLEIDAENITNASVVGPLGGGSDSLRLRYLRWRTDVERFLLQLDAEAGDISGLQNERHRDLVRDAVPANQIYREAVAEVHLVLKILRDFIAKLRDRAEEEQDTDQGSIRFLSDSNHTYQYDPGTRLGPVGAYGEVFRGKDDQGVAIAVKRVLIRTDTTSNRINDTRLADREAEVGRRLRQIRGDYIVPVIDTAHLESELLLIMPLATESLADRIARQGRLTSVEVVEVVKHVASGMQELAFAGVVHRDIKPRNVLLLNSRWCLAGFGISRILDTATATLTWMGTGTIEYRAPELWQGDPERVASDLYALGCLASEALTGEPPFPGPDFRDQHLTLVPQLPSDCDPILRTLVLDLLSKSPSARPVDARQVIERLSPAGELTEGQRILQQLRAIGAERDMEIASRDAATRQHNERVRQALHALDALWRSTVEHARQAVPDVRSLQTENSRRLIIGRTDADFRIRAPEEAGGELLLWGSIHVRADVGHAFLHVASLVAIWEDGRSQWVLITRRRTDRAQTEGAITIPLASPPEEVALEDLWFAYRKHPEEAGIELETAKAGTLVDLIARGAKRSIAAGPPRPSADW
jgi:serine/threonine protein kinase